MATPLSREQRWQRWQLGLFVARIETRGIRKAYGEIRVESKQLTQRPLASLDLVVPCVHGKEGGIAVKSLRNASVAPTSGVWRTESWEEAFGRRRANPKNTLAAAVAQCECENSVPQSRPGAAHRHSLGR